VVSHGDAERLCRCRYITAMLSCVLGQALRISGGTPPGGLARVTLTIGRKRNEVEGSQIVADRL
jgi:hypothetical protein